MNIIPHNQLKRGEMYYHMYNTKTWRIVEFIKISSDLDFPIHARIAYEFGIEGSSGEIGDITEFRGDFIKLSEVERAIFIDEEDYEQASKYII